MKQESEDYRAADDCGESQAEAEEGVKTNHRAVSARFFKNLPPPVRKRLEGIIRQCGERMLHGRVCAVRALRREHGFPFDSLHTFIGGFMECLRARARQGREAARVARAAGRALKVTPCGRRPGGASHICG